MTEEIVRTEGETDKIQIVGPEYVDARCSKCSGTVRVPTVVHWSSAQQRWREQAHCTNCFRGYEWYDGSRERPPAASPGTDAYKFYEGWYSDRPLDAPSPIEVKGLGPVKL